MLTDTDVRFSYHDRQTYVIENRENLGKLIIGKQVSEVAFIPKLPEQEIGLQVVVLDNNGKKFTQSFTFSVNYTTLLERLKAMWRILVKGHS